MVIDASVWGRIDPTFIFVSSELCAHEAMEPAPPCAGLAALTAWQGSVLKTKYHNIQYITLRRGMP
jgi:hypothetical protein